MRKFKNINNKRVINKETYYFKAKEVERFAKILDPEEKVSICDCLIRTETSSLLLITGVKYEQLKWEHVLVRVDNRYPTHREMIFAKELFWDGTEIAFQIFPEEQEKVNNEYYTLHLWRDSEVNIIDEYYMENLNKLCYNMSKGMFNAKKDSFDIDDEYGRRIIVFGPMHWLIWPELVQEKEKYFGKNSTGVQLFTNKVNDDNSEYLSIIWDAKNFRKPPKRIV